MIGHQRAGRKVGSRERIPSTSAQSSSLAIKRSTCGSSFRIVLSASRAGGVPGSHRHRFLRKFRSQETVRPRSLAARTASKAALAAVRDRAGVIPVVWNHVASARIAAQS